MKFRDETVVWMAFLTLLAAILLLIGIGSVSGQTQQYCPPGQICPLPQQGQGQGDYRDYPGVCRIQVFDQGGVQSWGSGTLIHVTETHGYVLTAAHVVADRATGSERVVVRFPKPGGNWGAIVVKEDKNLDLACLLIRAPMVRPMPVRRALLVVGEALYGAGYGARGIFRRIAGRLSGFSSNGITIFIDGASARQGDSGGPVIDSSGKLAGVLWGTGDRDFVGTTNYHINIFMKDVKGYESSGKQDQPQSRPSSPPPPPSDLKAEIVALQARIAKLESGGVSGPPGPRGPPGPVTPLPKVVFIGPDGKPVREALVKDGVIEIPGWHWRRVVEGKVDGAKAYWRHPDGRLFSVIDSQYILPGEDLKVEVRGETIVKK